jgi:hypothetical protein
MTRDARLSALHRGGFGPRGRASVSFGARRPTTAGSCLRIRAASSSQPGRSAWRAGSRASRGERLRAAAAGRHASLRLQDRLRRRPSNERGCERCSMHSLRSQECSWSVVTPSESSPAHRSCVSFVFNILAPKLSNPTLTVDTRSLPTRSVARPGATVLSPLSDAWVVHRILNA